MTDDVDYCGSCRDTGRSEIEAGIQTDCDNEDGVICEDHRDADVGVGRKGDTAGGGASHALATDGGRIR